MANCDFCSAPLVANSQFCGCCGNRNDVDVKRHIEFSSAAETSHYPCPHCLSTLTFFTLNFDNDDRIAHCQSCFGIFLERNILERLLEETVNPVHSINFQQLQAINIDRFPGKRPVKYLRCPICQSFMRRTNFAYRSGVVVDICRDHGIWLDAGELKQLMEWKKAGGQILADQELQTQSRPTRSSSSRHHPVNMEIEHSQEWLGLVDADLVNVILESIANWLKS